MISLAITQNCLIGINHPISNYHLYKKLVNIKEPAWNLPGFRGCTQGMDENGTNSKLIPGNQLMIPPKA
jgi:hypothetical protein